KMLFLTFVLVGVTAQSAAATEVTVIEVNGSVSVRAKGAEAFSRAQKGDRIGQGARLRTGDDGKAKLRFADGTISIVRPKTEIAIDMAPQGQTGSNAVVLFFGRLWSSVVKSATGTQSFEVRGANAVAGVRGTIFEVGVADDGAVRVAVSEGQVDVNGDDGDGTVSLTPGFQVDGNPQGHLHDHRKSPETQEWSEWFDKRAAHMHQRGQAIAKHLHGRLDARRKKLERLVTRQNRARQRIRRLRAQLDAGAPVRGQLQRNLRELERVTERLQDMQQRLQPVFGLFEMWGRKAPTMKGAAGRQIGLMAEDVKRVAKGFADLFEEGTDQSEEALDEMIEGMKGGPTLKRKKSVKDELF
ncbi:MAG: FecR family protein, partial [Myxococcota bacterium]